MRIEQVIEWVELTGNNVSTVRGGIYAAVARSKVRNSKSAGMSFKVEAKFEIDTRSREHLWKIQRGEILYKEHWPLSK